MKKKHKNNDYLNQNKETKESTNHYNEKYEDESENSENKMNNSLSPLIHAHDSFESELKQNNKKERMKKNKSNIVKRETNDYLDSENSSSYETNNSNNKMSDPKKKEKKLKENKNSNLSIDNVTTEDMLNYFIDHYNNEISIEHDELCQILTGKKYFDIERLTKNLTDITHQSLMIKSIQKEKEQFCKHCGYIFNYDDYNYLFIKRFNMSKLNYDDNNPALCENTIKCIYCGYIIDDLDINDNINYNPNNYIELHSYREKYLFDNNKKMYWQNKIATFDKNVELFKEGENAAYNITYEKCTDCGHDFLYFVNIQTRSADEGSTIIYFCPNCKKQTTVNN
ncbi:transcription factor, putative [Plasmodium chabaudi adami]|uniref:Transcription factor, putative n=1 Tax=Plasmodium chabaudi adami TaxID=5826 RepID=A0A1D3LJY7_PLACE|nr:transcription factor, putative [Plasmodium chabaudi adami]